MSEKTEGRKERIRSNRKRSIRGWRRLVSLVLIVTILFSAIPESAYAKNKGNAII